MPIKCEISLRCCNLAHDNWRGKRDTFSLACAAEQTPESLQTCLTPLGRLMDVGFAA